MLVAVCAAGPRWLSAFLNKLVTVSPSMCYSDKTIRNSHKSLLLHFIIDITKVVEGHQGDHESILLNGSALIYHLSLPKVGKIFAVVLEMFYNYIANYHLWGVKTVGLWYLTFTFYPQECYHLQSYHVDDIVVSFNIPCDKKSFLANEHKKH